MTYQTIDFDFNDKAKFKHLFKKIHKCPFLITIISTEPSVSMTGFHIRYYCKLKDTCMCRFTLDDQNRFHKDQERPKQSQNVLFERKLFRINGKVVLVLQK